ncbi:hypothetical protein Mapa_013515 [Marchantia paleacea]|nr:hypothetical protein Mapa_013515 [Marchantia paleacea]
MSAGGEMLSDSDESFSKSFKKPRKDDIDRSTVEYIFGHITNRKCGLIRALTFEFDEFYRKCDPGAENLSLYGLPNSRWEVRVPDEKVPSELPEPVVGINFCRDGMANKNWVKFIALHCDAWILSLAAFYASELKRDERLRLFCMLNELPTIFEIVTGKDTDTTTGAEIYANGTGVQFEQSPNLASSNSNSTGISNGSFQTVELLQLFK